MKTLVITGASKGIGLATARLFCDSGYKIINFSRTSPPDDRFRRDSTRQILLVADDAAASNATA